MPMMPIPSWWGTPDKITLRLEAEFRAMRSVFGSTFELHTPQAGERIFWQGTVSLNMKGVEPREHIIRINYPHRFPMEAPEAFIVKPRIVSQHYQHSDGRLSLFSPHDGTSYGWNPSTGTAVSIASWSIHWLYCYYTYQLIHVWPDP